MNKLTVSVRAAAEMLSLGTTSIHKLMNAGQLTRVKVGRRTLITLESVERIAKGEVA